MSEDFNKFWGYVLVFAFLSLLWNSIGAQVKSGQTIQTGYSNQATVILNR